MQPQLVPPETETPLEVLGFSGPNVARLKAINLATLGDLISRQEEITSWLVSSSLPAGRSVHDIEAPAGVINRLKCGDLSVETIEQLLQRNPCELRRHRCFGWRTIFQLMSGLKKLGYSGDDGPFLRDDILASVIKAQTYAEILILRRNGALSQEFISWFNYVIKRKKFAIGCQVVEPL
jgi:hypothetical protein